MKKQLLISGNSSNVSETQHDDNLDVVNNEENVEEELSPDLIEASDDQSNSRSERKRKKSKKKRLKREQDEVVQERSLATIEEKEESCEGENLARTQRIFYSWHLAIELVCIKLGMEPTTLALSQVPLGYGNP